MFQQVYSIRFLIRFSFDCQSSKRLFLPFPGTVIVNSAGSRKNNRTANPAIIYSLVWFFSKKININILHNRSMVENEHNANPLYFECKPNWKKSIEFDEEKIVLTASPVPRIPPANGQVPNRPNIEFRWASVTQAPRPLFAAAQHKDYRTLHNNPW